MRPQEPEIGEIGEEDLPSPQGWTRRPGGRTR